MRSIEAFVDFLELFCWKFLVNYSVEINRIDWTGRLKRRVNYSRDASPDLTQSFLI